MKADLIIWKKALKKELFNVYDNISDKRNLASLTCSEDPNIIIACLNKVPPGHSQKIIDHKINEILQRKEYYINIFLPIIEKHTRNNKVLNYLLETFKRIDSR